MVDLMPGKVPAEYLYDASAKTVRVYLDEATAQKTTSVAMLSLVKVGEVDEFPFEKAGDAWESRDENVVKLLRQGQSAKMTLNVMLEGDKLLSAWRYLSLP